jgi:hypothetical protein
MRAQKILGIGMIVLASSSLSACSKKTLLESMDLEIIPNGSGGDLRLSSTVKLGNMSLPEIEIPIQAPGSTLSLGNMALKPDANGKQEISITLNSAALLHADPALGSTLPNGRALPSAIGFGESGGALLALPIRNSSRIYLGGDLKTRIILGVALVLPALDPVTASLPVGANAFFKRPFSSTISGVGGVFSSPQARQSGIAVFGILNANPASKIGSTLALQQKSTSARQGGSVEPKTVNALRIMQFFTGPAQVLDID